MACATKTTSADYAKRPGTSGIRGHLYETKLLSLIYFRAIHDDDIEEFHLATNVDNMGSFDDICFRVKWKDVDKPIVVFIQVKHRETSQRFSLPRIDLVKYFKSYLEIKRKFQSNNKDVLFEGTFSETECLFVIYTTATLDNEVKTYEAQDSKLGERLQKLIGTAYEANHKIIKACHNNMSLNNFSLKKITLEEHITALARQMAKCIFGELSDSHMLMQNEFIIRYHVILAQKIFDVSEDQTEGQRIARFRQDFFHINEEFLLLFKDELCTEILKRRKRVNLVEYNVFPSLLEVTDVDGLNNKVRGFITYRNGKFECLDKIIPDSASVLNKINESQETIRRTLELAVKECLPSLEFKVPAAFGNKDLMIRGDENKIERKLNDLTSKIVRLIEKSNVRYFDDYVFIDKSMGEGFLQHNGGIASAVGNVLISTDHNLLKFDHRYESLGPLAKRLFDKLESKLKSIFDYKFKAIVEIFPKCSFVLVNECYERNRKDPDVESEFLNKLHLYTSQHSEQQVEETLIHEIHDSQIDDVRTIYSKAIYFKYHDAIQKWWMTYGTAPYLTKEGSLYQYAVKHASSLPLTSVMNMIHRNKINKYTLIDDAVNSIKLDDQPSGTIIVSDNSPLTVAKFTQKLNKECIMLDLKYVLNLSAKDYQTLHSELTNTDEIKTVIVIFVKALDTTNFRIKIQKIANSIQDKKVIFITDQNSFKIIRQYFSGINNEIEDKRCKLIDMSEESKECFLENTKVIFQSNWVGLNQVLDDESKKFVGGGILHILKPSNKKNIGKPVSNLNDITISYIQRTVINLGEGRRSQRLPTNERRDEGISKQISTLYDIEEDVVLIVGDPGMGKSTLLTHLSLKTKKLDPTVWILRINLLENSRQFSEWQEDKTDIDILESLKFLCQIALSEDRSRQDDIQITLEESNGTVHLKNCTGDEWTVFELQMFIHYFKTKNIIILFDGFDEICPTYAHEVLTLIGVVENFPQKHKMWITSRSYDKIISILELRFRTLYKIKPLKENEQHEYLQKFWKNTRISEGLRKLNIHQNIHDFSMFMLNSIDLKFVKKDDLLVQSKTEMPFLVVYLSFVKYLLPLYDTNVFDYSYWDSYKRKLDGDVDIKKVEDCQKLFEIALDALKEISEQIPSLHSNEFVATPLHLNMTADYLYKQITTNTRKPNKWDTNMFGIYESFLETKLKIISFQEKNQNDMTKPDNISHYKRVYADTMDKHKKLATYALYDKCLFNDDELKQCKEMINELKEGKEKTGIICNVVHDIPIFVHSTFAEYFAVEHVCDLLKSKRNPKPIWDFILNVMFFKNINALVLLDAKEKVDDKLSILVEQNKQMIFEMLLEQSESTKHMFGDVKSSLCEAVRHDLRHLGSLLLLTIEYNLKEKNITDFIKIVKETNMLIVAVKMEFEDVVVTIVDSLRIIDDSKLSALFENIEGLEFNQNINVISTDELVQKLHTYVWTRMDIVPEWQNLAEFSGQIYFI